MLSTYYLEILLVLTQGELVDRQRHRVHIRQLWLLDSIGQICRLFSQKDPLRLWNEKKCINIQLSKYTDFPVSAVFWSQGNRTIWKTALIGDWFSTKITIWDFLIFKVPFLLIFIAGFWPHYFCFELNGSPMALAYTT